MEAERNRMAKILVYVMQNIKVWERAMLYSTMSSIATKPQKSQQSVFNHDKQKYPQEYK